MSLQDQDGWSGSRVQDKYRRGAHAPRQRKEGLFDVDVALRRRLEEAQAKFVCEFLPLLLRDDLRSARSQFCCSTAL